MNKRKILIDNTQKLDYDSKIELLHYITNTFNLNFMENTNGIFFSLNEIDDNNISEILSKVDTLLGRASEMNKYNLRNKNDIETGNYDILNNGIINDDDDDVKSESLNKKPFDYDKTFIKDIEYHMSKTNKKSIHIKYSIAKKKYNKQIQIIDTKKIENIDLNELTEDKYIY